MNGHRPRKRFGQHFLTSRTVIQALVEAIAPRADDPMVEIGPGLGALTRALLPHLRALHVVELDRDLISGLETLAAQGPAQLLIHQGDALRFDFADLARQLGRPLRVVGNLPYNISTPLIFHLLEAGPQIADMHFMLQKEVVDRLAAAPGGKDYGRLSVMVQAYCQVAPLFHVPPGAFNPPPKVDSAVVRLLPLTQPLVPPERRAGFARLVAAAFAQRRKTLANTLKGLLDPEAIRACGVDPGARAETLAVADFVRLAAALHNRGA
ncbi:16S rRNA (adenine(1518)-N(6)/adenine(1519)-N(6))-dimethyltransferase RsmA [Thermithiobacillus tepidarius DSM 3134]|uniref:16S rRNA (adenine(1518)-N(6)/adenine(1519)-N(6))- dimethyltransferase RsmA n=1 Tax=Thermithiobacillus tepidarius TaxID=929 RepID=UPI0004020435|nr:16S rRNA (adenine(1518)-N(6)/adenine(1519)-N(6))-dimethyltransferase RsmA [Thermithiobacillus tepidarius]